MSDMPQSKTSKSFIAGKELVNARVDKGWTREIAAENLDISASYLAALETKGRSPGYKLFCRIVETYNLSPNDLVLNNSQADKASWSTDRLQIEEMLDSLTSDEITYIKTCIRAFIEYNSKEKSTPYDK